jgi:hypothetical protein
VDDVAKRKFLTRTPDTSVVLPVASRYKNWAVDIM